MMVSHSSPNKVALIVGYAGLIPFVSLSAALVYANENHQAVFLLSLLAYGSTIISFLGAIHWGLTMREVQDNWFSLIWGVVPSILAWLSLLFADNLGLTIQFMTLWACFFIDLKRYPYFGVAPWLTLRLKLTLGASICLLIPLIIRN
jgi:hypothetical protein